MLELNRVKRGTPFGREREREGERERDEKKR
jgi:hypothetical protein